MSKTKGEYHYAIQALESRLDKITKRPEKFSKPKDRIKSIKAALDVLRINDMPSPAHVPLELNEAAFIGLNSKTELTGLAGGSHEDDGA